MNFPLSSECSSEQSLAFVSLSFVLTRRSFHISFAERTVDACLRWDCRSALSARFLFDGVALSSCFLPPSNLRFFESAADDFDDEDGFFLLLSKDLAAMVSVIPKRRLLL